MNAPGQPLSGSQPFVVADDDNERSSSGGGRWTDGEHSDFLVSGSLEGWLSERVGNIHVAI